MGYKNWRNTEVNSLLMEKWGYEKPQQPQPQDKCVTHLCSMEVKELATGRIGHPINHTLLEDGTVTHYDVEFGDVIVEGMPASVLEATVLETHGHEARREDYPHDEDKPREQYMEEEEALEEEKELEEGEKLEEEELEEGEELDEKKKLSPEELGALEGGPETTRADIITASGGEGLDEAKIREMIRGIIKRKLGNGA